MSASVADALRRWDRNFNRSQTPVPAPLQGRLSSLLAGLDPALLGKHFRADLEFTIERG